MTIFLYVATMLTIAAAQGFTVTGEREWTVASCLVALGLFLAFFRRINTEEQP